MKIYFVAGEASGDLLGSKLIRALKSLTPTPLPEGEGLEVYGVGGGTMEAEGLQSLFPMRDLSLFGFAEVLPHIPKVLSRLKMTVADILEKKPDVVITIDSPGFNFRLAKKLKGSGIPLIHYVAPTVWAYKPGRAQKMTEWYDFLLLILPFEPPYFDAVGLKNTFVGHPIIEEKTKPANTNTNSKNLLILPGSRKGELNRHLPIFGEALKRLKNIDRVTLVTLPHLEETIEEHTKDWPVAVDVVSDAQSRLTAFQNAAVALTKSGTVGLELALHNVPMVVTYKVNPISAWILRRMIKINYAHLVNLLLDRQVIPELLQEDCTPENLSAAVAELMEDDAARSKQQAGMHEALQMLGLGKTPTPSEKAAEAVLSFIKSGCETK